MARQILEGATVSEVGDLTVGELCLFPREDAAYWAGQVASLPPGLDDRLRLPLRSPPEDLTDWAQVWELAQGHERLRALTAHWYALPVDQLMAREARRRRDREHRAQLRRAELRYDETALNARLAALTADEVPARQGWLEVIADLYRSSDGETEVVIENRLDFRGAPSFPAPNSELLDRLVRAAAIVIRAAPVISVADVDPTGMSLGDVPELLALSLLTVASHPESGDLDEDRWAGLALALIFVFAAPADHELRSRLLATGIQNSGTRVEEALPGLLDQLDQNGLTTALSRLGPALTPGLTARLREWAQSPSRAIELWEPVMDTLAQRGDPEALATLRGVIPLARDQYDSDTGGHRRQQWLSAASILARHDTATSWAAIYAVITAIPELARQFLDRLADHSGLGGWPMDMDALTPEQMADLYDLTAAHGPDPGTELLSRSGAGYFGPDQKLERMRSQLPQIISARMTQQASDQLRALADRYPDHWQLTELARMHARERAAQAWRPLGLEDLLKLADNGVLRLVRDEHQLREVVTESLLRLQHLLSRPNGWVTLLWHKNNQNAAGGWWPAWEEDLSDLIATFLQHDQAERQVIVNREVQILRPGLNGRRTDIHVQANPRTPAPELEPLTVIIECKGCWNDDLTTALANQLVSQYLSTPGRNAGIYLVGYFDNPRWDHTAHPGREHTQHELEDIRAQQDNIAREQAAQKSVSVTAFILDCLLSARQASKAERNANPDQADGELLGQAAHSQRRLRRCEYTRSTPVDAESCL